MMKEFGEIKEHSCDALRANDLMARVEKIFHTCRNIQAQCFL